MPSNDSPADPAPANTASVKQGDQEEREGRLPARDCKYWG